ncbi:helix-turn-helix transcriptional regulator [Actinosynnema sp. CS-041913]|uniref:helix-turn-helix transcriptional regulator n=1 Tax=Actinosynnema sp. CS-041913 TaxID=3239917 RepID=UPI003D8CEBFE
MTEREGPTVDEPAPAAARLAQEIKRRRTDAKLSQPELATKIGYTRQYVSLAERATNNLPSRELVQALDRALEAGGALLALRDTAKAEQRSKRRPDMPAKSADGARMLVPVLVDGQVVLLPMDTSAGPTDEHWFTTAAGWGAMNRLDRRSFLQHGLAAAALPALGLDELQHVAAALNQAGRYLDGTVVDYFRAQFAGCAADDGRLGPGKTLPVLVGLLGAVDKRARDVRPEVRRELLKTAAVGAELAGWLYRDLRDFVLAQFWRDRATEWAQEAGDTAMQGYVLLKKAQAAYDERDALRMLTLSEAAQAGPWRLPVRVRAEVAQQEARGHAMLGHDGALVARKLDQAHELLAEADEQVTESALGAHYNRTLLTMQTAICHTEAGRPRRAAELYEEWLSTNQFSPRDYGYFLSLKASALALAGEPDQAAQTGITALKYARDANSARTVQELTKVLQTLEPWRNRAVVRELRGAVKA